MTILRIHGPFLLATTEKPAEETEDLKKFGSVVIPRVRNMTAADATGLPALEVFSGRPRKTGRTLLRCGERDQSASMLEQPEFVRHIGRENILPHEQAALDRAREVYSRVEGIGTKVARHL